MIFQDTKFFQQLKVQEWCIPFWNSQINRHTEMRL